MAAKPLDVIVGQPTTATMDKMTEQMAQMVAPVKTTAWGGLHGSLALVLDDADYEIVTKAVVKNTTRLAQPDSVNPNITDSTSQHDLLTLQAETKRLQKEFDLQEAVTNFGMQRIIDSMNSTSKNSTKNILVTPTAPSKVFSIISVPTGARS